MGIIINLGFKFFNPSNIPLFANNLAFYAYRLDGEKLTLLGNKSTDTCELTPNKTVCVKTQVRITYIKYFTTITSRILPDWLILKSKEIFQ